MNLFIEEQARLAPAEYFWTHKRFKTRPPGEASLYEAQPARQPSPPDRAAA
jgi:Kdo2-lipid IVA lauroyltransferase/acyltransferase